LAPSVPVSNLRREILVMRVVGNGNPMAMNERAHLREFSSRFGFIQPATETPNAGRLGKWVQHE
ncbi:MAG: hypothetical protein ACTH8R_13155, partial [Glutamicibacter arilaitensis]